MINKKHLVLVTVIGAASITVLALLFTGEGVMETALVFTGLAAATGAVLFIAWWTEKDGWEK